MDRPPPRDQETRELIQRFQAKRERRRRLRLLLGSLIGAVVVAVIVAAVVLAVRGPDDQAAVGPPTDQASGHTSAAASAKDAGNATKDTGSAPTAAGVSTTAPSAAATLPPATLAQTTTTARPATRSRPSTTTSQPTTTTSVAATTTSVASTTSTAAAPPAAKVVVIDPGHQAKANYDTEPIGPGSSDYKAKVSSGTASVNTGAPESELVLAVSLKLRDALASHGIEVVMTRTTQDVNISNIERAQIANAAGAELFVRIHADGSSNPAVSGIHVLFPASIKGWTDDIAAVSKEAAILAQQELIAATGAIDRGIDARSDMTGFNWADVPVIIPEIGFMTNPAEDRLLATPAYQDKIVAGLTRAILAFLGVS